MTKLTMKTLTARCKFWQAQLRLQDWDIGLSIERMHVIDPNTLGACGAHGGKRQASIQLLDPRDSEAQGFSFNEGAWDWEVTLVHELLHLHVGDLFPEGWPSDSPAEIAAERLIDALSRAFVLLNNRKRR